MGYKNFKKKTNSVIEELVSRMISELYSSGLRQVHVRVKGFNYIRNVALRHLGTLSQMRILSIEDVTRVPFGGCLPKKAKRK